jgi:signal transduction histidine kinase
MHLPRLPVSDPDTDSVPVDSPSGFWPLGATSRASIISHTIDNHSPDTQNLDPRAVQVRDGNDLHWCTASAAKVATLRQQLGTLSDPIGFFISLFANAPVGCSILTADGHVLASNAAAIALFGGEPPPEYNVFTDNQAAEQGIAPAIRRAFLGEIVNLPTFWYDPRELKNVAVSEGRRVAISISISPIPDAKQKINHVALIYRDDTAVVLAQQQLQNQSEQLEQHIIGRTAELEEANEELEAFSYSVSHDLRAPLRAIDGFAAILTQDEHSQLSAHGQDCLRRIRNATARMGDLINDLLSFSRLGKQALTLKTVVPMQLVHQVLQELEPKLRDRAINIRVGKLPIVQADPALLREVFLNLLDNAIKFTGKCEHARIEIGTRVQDDQLVWYVSDNGVGFDMDHYPRLFGVFSRLHSMDEFEGTGVGLALIQRIVKRHGGEVWAHSEIGKGATFCFTLAA